MPLQKLSIQPGVVKDTTPALAEGRWVESDKMRFHLGLPRVIGGWQRIAFKNSPFLSLGNDPFSVVQGSPVVTVTSPNHGQVTGNIVSFSGVNKAELAQWGIDLNASFKVASVLNNNQFTVTLDSSVSQETAVGGGASVVAYYSPLYGTIRNLKSWTSDNGQGYQAVGTDNKLYIVFSNTVYDITPQGDPVVLTNPFTTNITPGTANSIIVNAPSHGAVAGQGVSFSGATPVGGLNMNASFIIQKVIDANTYTVQATMSATSAATGGGTVTALYDIPLTNGTLFLESGWSNHDWSGNFGWSEGPEDPTMVPSGTIWFFALFGETLLFAPQGGTLYKWDPSDDGVASRGQLVPNAPTNILAGLLVSAQDSRVLAIGAVQPTQPLSVAPAQVVYSAKGSYTLWRPNDPGFPDVIVAGGVSRLISARVVNNLIVLWSESQIFTINFVGAPVIFSINTIGTNAGLLSPNAAVAAEGLVFWMGDNNFYVYNGANPQTIPCTVRDFVFANLNPSIQVQQKVFCVTDSGFSEIWWFYPSLNSKNDECDSYVTYNYLEKVWTIGTFDVTAAEDRGPQDYPVWAHLDNYLYNHEFGLSANNELIEAFITSGPIDIASGEEFVFADRIIPDISFTTGAVEVLIEARIYPNSSPIPFGPFQFYPKRGTIEATTEVYPRARGRSLAFRFSSFDTGIPEDTNWRLGNIIVSVQPSGKK